MCIFLLKWSSIGWSLGIVQWDFTRRDHPGNPGRVFGSGPIMQTLRRLHGLLLRAADAELGLADEVVVAGLTPALLGPRIG